MGRKSKAHKLAVIAGTEAPIRHNRPKLPPVRRQATLAELVSLIGMAQWGEKQ